MPDALPARSLDATTTRYYASLPRRLIWIVLLALLLWGSIYYLERRLYLATAICILWLPFTTAWVYHLFRTPIATVAGDTITLLERLHFGRANLMTLRRGELQEVGQERRGRIALVLTTMGPRIINLKYLSRRQRAAVIAALRQLTG